MLTEHHYVGPARAWDPGQAARDDMLIEADMHEEVLSLTAQIDAIERRELARAIGLYRKFARLADLAETAKRPRWTRMAIVLAKTRCAKAIIELGGELPA